MSVTVIIPTRNEEQNLPDALESVEWADRVVVVDSQSADRTAEIANRAGAEVVQFEQSTSPVVEFEEHAACVFPGTFQIVDMSRPPSPS